MLLHSPSYTINFSQNRRIDYQAAAAELLFFSSHSLLVHRVRRVASFGFGLRQICFRLPFHLSNSTGWKKGAGAGAPSDNMSFQLAHPLQAGSGILQFSCNNQSSVVSVDQ